MGVWYFWPGHYDPERDGNLRYGTLGGSPLLDTILVTQFALASRLSRTLNLP